MANKPRAEKLKAHKKSTSWLDEYQIFNPGMRQFLLALAKKGTITGACRELGCADLKIQNWRKGFNTHAGRPSTPTEEGLRFDEAFKEAKRRYVENLEMELDRRAMKGSDNLLMFRLKGELPEKYRESWRTAGSPNSTPSPGLGAPTTVNQLIQIGLQEDPEKFKSVLELANKLGIMDRLLTPPPAADPSALPVTPHKEVTKPMKDGNGDFLPERGEEDDPPEAIEKEVPRGPSGS